MYEEPTANRLVFSIYANKLARPSWSNNFYLLTLAPLVNVGMATGFEDGGKDIGS